MKRFKEMAQTFTDRLPGGSVRQERRGLREKTSLVAEKPLQPEQTVSASEARLVTEGPLQAERQTFMDVARKAFKQTGFGYVEWKNPFANVPSENATVESVEYASSYVEDSSTHLVRLLRGNFTPKYSTAFPARYRLEVGFNKKTHNVDVRLGRHEQLHDGHTEVTLNPDGKLVKLRSADYWYDQLESERSDLEKPTRKRDEEATLEEVKLVLADATTFLVELQEKPEWKAKPKGPVYGGGDLAVVGG